MKVIIYVKVYAIFNCVCHVPQIVGDVTYVITGSALSIGNKSVLNTKFLTVTCIF